MSVKKFEVAIKRTVTLTDEDIDDIMVSALEGGITYWCYKAEVVGNYLGKYASEQISRGGSLKLYDFESGDKYWLTLDKFLDGFIFWVEQGYDKYGAVSFNREYDESGAVYRGEVDTGMIDGEAADCIIQLALFGDVIYG